MQLIRSILLLVCCVSIVSVSSAKKTSLKIFKKSVIVTTKQEEKIKMPLIVAEASKSDSIGQKALTAWGVLQVVGFISHTLKRLLPIALEPFSRNDLTGWQWGLYGVWALYMAHKEGYEAFHQKFSPLVVKRAQGLAERPGFFGLNWFFAGPFSMGLFGATKNRMKTSWSVIALVFGVVQVVKKLEYPWRSIVDGGVVLGLTIGTLSTVWHLCRALVGISPNVDAAFEPTRKE